ncbi:MAG: hypothetical protein K2N56_12020 [Oscillospiraceae bacterium]|nr:hypothetical protein [Oscillospiraceae bacterium]
MLRVYNVDLSTLAKINVTKAAQSALAKFDVVNAQEKFQKAALSRTPLAVCG